MTKEIICHPYRLLVTLLIANIALCLGEFFIYIATGSWSILAAAVVMLWLIGLVNVRGIHRIVRIRREARADLQGMFDQIPEEYRAEAIAQLDPKLRAIVKSLGIKGIE